MSDRDGIFAGDDPFKILMRWMGEADASELNDPNAAALATVDQDGLPNARVVLVKDVEPDAVVFYTNYTSKKAGELDASGKAALVLHWKSLRRQVRLRGAVVREDGAKADEYFASRALKSRIGAIASRQSQPLAARKVLEDAAKSIAETLGDAPQRPAFWGGYRLMAHELEFWADGEFRLHDRFRWHRQATDRDWEVTRLYP